MDDERVYMRALAAALDRSSGTIRGWERDGLLPLHLLPARDEKGWRYWTPKQADQVKAWMLSNSMAPGKGLPGFTPSTGMVQDMLRQLRRPRDLEPESCPQCGKSVRNLAAHVRLAHPEAA